MTKSASVMYEMNIITTEGAIMLIPISSAHLILLYERNTVKAKNKVGMPTQAKTYFATMLAF